MVRRTRRWRAPKLDFDHHAAFIEAGKRIARGSGILHSYRKGCGMLLLANRSHVAQVSLEAAIAHCIETLDTWSANDWSKCWEHVGKHATCAYIGQWWETSLCREPPVIMGPGDEFYSRETIRLIVERSADTTPDRMG